MRFYLFLVFLCISPLLAGDDFATARDAMVAEINEMTRYTSDLTGKTILSKRVMDVMNRVPRHEFVSADMRAFAYQNHALPLASNQTISQPYIVALMTDLADVDEEDTVLEVGTGSGYQAAVLAELCRKVYSVEIIESLGEQASLILQRLGYGNVSLRIGDGYHGWPEAAPFDAILVTAAPETVPEALLEQLRSGGKLVIPLGQQGSIQTLRVFEKNEQGEIKKRDILPVGFVPLTRED